jgi:hypothetical protein
MASSSPYAVSAEPCGWSRSKVQDFASEVASKLGYRPGDSLEPIVGNLGGEIEIAPDEVGASTGSIVVAGPGKFTIFLSPYSGQMRDRFTIAHEIGHYVLHSQLGKKPVTVLRDGTGRLEWEANWFAAGFLMPEKEFRSLVRKGYGEASLAVHFGVSEAAVSVRRSSMAL